MYFLRGGVVNQEDLYEALKTGQIWVSWYICSDTPNCNNVVMEKMENAKSLIGINYIVAIVMARSC